MSDGEGSVSEQIEESIANDPDITSSVGEDFGKFKLPLSQRTDASKDESQFSPQHSEKEDDDDAGQSARMESTRETDRDYSDDNEDHPESPEPGSGGRQSPSEVIYHEDSHKSPARSHQSSRVESPQDLLNLDDDTNRDKYEDETDDLGSPIKNDSNLLDFSDEKTASPESSMHPSPGKGLKELLVDDDEAAATHRDDEEISNFIETEKEDKHQEEERETDESEAAKGNENILDFPALDPFLLKDDRPPEQSSKKSSHHREDSVENDTSCTSSVSLGMKTAGEQSTSRPSDPRDSGSMHKNTKAEKPIDDLEHPEVKIIYRQLMDAAREKDAAKVRFIHSSVSSVAPGRWLQYMEHLSPEDRNFITITLVTGSDAYSPPGMPYPPAGHGYFGYEDKKPVEEIITKTHYTPLMDTDTRMKGHEPSSVAVPSYGFNSSYLPPYTSSYGTSKPYPESARTTSDTYRLDEPPVGSYSAGQHTFGSARRPQEETSSWKYNTYNKTSSSTVGMDPDIARLQEDLERMRKERYNTTNRRTYNPPVAATTNGSATSTYKSSPYISSTVSGYGKGPVKATAPLSSYPESGGYFSGSQKQQHDNRLAEELLLENRRIRRTVESLHKKDELREDVLRQTQALVDELRGEILRLTKRVNERRFGEGGVEHQAELHRTGPQDANLLRQVLRDYRQLSDDYERMQGQVQQAWTNASLAEKSTWRAEKTTQNMEKELQRLKDENTRLRRQLNTGTATYGTARGETNNNVSSISRNRTVSGTSAIAPYSSSTLPTRSYASVNKSYKPAWNDRFNTMDTNESSKERPSRLGTGTKNPLSQSMMNLSSSPNMKEKSTYFSEARDISPSRSVVSTSATWTQHAPSRSRSALKPASSSYLYRSHDNLHTLEKRYDTLQWKKRDVETALSHLPTSASTLLLAGSANSERLSSLQKQEQLERKLNRIEREISSLRLKLRQANVLLVK